MLFVHFLFILFILKSSNAISSHPLVLVVSYDAFRYNYIEKGVTPTLKKLRDDGCSIKPTKESGTSGNLENVFITKTFTNHHSISTGVYPAVHGVMGNSFFDPVIGKKLDYSYEMWHYNDKIVPIWIENQRRGGGRHSGVMMWPGNEYNYTGVRPTFQQAWTESMAWEQRVDTALSWFQHPATPANLVMLYLEEPDSHSHAFGPDSPQVRETLRKMDANTKYLLDKLEANGLKSRVNMFLVSDHGMESVTKKDIIDLRPYVDESLYDFYETSPTLHIYPKKGMATRVYNGLMRATNDVGGFKVYKAQELRADWHYNNLRTPPILLVADPPHVFHDFYHNIEFMENKYKFKSTNESTFGVHGYDNKHQSMRPYFIANGPAVRNKTQVPSFRTIDLFAMWAQLLGFPEAAQATNGSLAPANTVLKPRPSPRPHVSTASIAAAVTGVGLVLGAMAVTVYFLHRKLQHKYQALLQTEDLTRDDSRQRLLDSEEEA